MSSPNSQTPTLYFAYGSNLSLAQMASRCPTSKYHSFGVLKNWKWIIGPRGYANVLASNSSSDVVYGLLYTLTPRDEAALDIAEGVPNCYVKKLLLIQLLPSPGPQRDEGVVEALVYVDVVRPGTGVCKEEYVARMNRGIRDAVAKGMPEAYVRDVMRVWFKDEVVPGDGDDEAVDDPFHPQKVLRAVVEGVGEGRP